MTSAVIHPRSDPFLTQKKNVLNWILRETGTLPPTFVAGRLGEITVSGTEVLLGPPVRFNAANIADFDF